MITFQNHMIKRIGMIEPLPDYLVWVDSYYNKIFKKQIFIYKFKYEDEFEKCLRDSEHPFHPTDIDKND